MLIFNGEVEFTKCVDDNHIILNILINQILVIFLLMKKTNLL